MNTPTVDWYDGYIPATAPNGDMVAVAGVHHCTPQGAPVAVPEAHFHLDLHAHTVMIGDGAHADCMACGESWAIECPHCATGEGHSHGH